MGAPIGNDFWTARSKHGREKLFTSPEILWEAACEYFTWCKNNPWFRTEYIGKEVIEVKIPIERPFTLIGLCVFLGVSSSYFRVFKSTLKEADKEYLTVITRIEEIIYTQQFEGATVGVFKENIISRNLGLKDNTDITSNGEKINLTISENVNPNRKDD